MSENTPQNDHPLLRRHFSKNKPFKSTDAREVVNKMIPISVSERDKILLQKLLDGSVTTDDWTTWVIHGLHVLDVDGVKTQNEEVVRQFANAQREEYGFRTLAGAIASRNTDLVQRICSNNAEAQNVIGGLIVDLHKSESAVPAEYYQLEEIWRLLPNIDFSDEQIHTIVVSIDEFDAKFSV